MDYKTFYSNQNLPPFAPPGWLFGVVWPILYILIFISYGIVFYKTGKGERSFWFITPFVINLIANFSFTYFQFKLRNNYLALADILIVLITIVITIFLLWGKDRTLAYMQFPYLLWVLFATYLQIGITLLNK